jgi:hypothetical protein
VFAATKSATIEHATLPTIDEYFPTPQLTHVVEPLIEEYLLSAQLRHTEESDASTVDENDPAGHPTQLVELGAPRALEYMPPEQFKQVVDVVAPKDDE